MIAFPVTKTEATTYKQYYKFSLFCMSPSFLIFFSLKLLCKCMSREFLESVCKSYIREILSAPAPGNPTWSLTYCQVYPQNTKYYLTENGGSDPPGFLV